ncbi:glycine receptor subunit alpha-2-like [Branchiostoma floridae]|uniref:Glycine receptor subunit alpha-2-like n=1 Tax=Branchiostoma floridae TaxID=7739 RepID=A0A9J7LP93_BRAFL|nr:glycine receptor subunit alpha-2-like [Branchiostoma floridae]
MSVQETATPTESFFRLLDDYDHRIRPNFNGAPVNVTCDIFVQSMGSVKETTMDYIINVFFRQRWNDPRLSFKQFNETLTLDASVVGKIWVPDVFFVNEKGANFHDVTTANRMLRVDPTGTILYSTRLTLTLACPMNLYRFPMDRQQCGLKMESYGKTEADIMLHWKWTRPVEFDASVELPQFYVENIRTNRTVQNYNTGQYTRLTATFDLQRQMGFYLIQVYIPTMLIVILSWVSFWINIEAAPARVALGITTVLTMTTQGSAQGGDVKVSYVKAIDIWLAVCLLFVFAALIEFAAVNFMSRQDKNRDDRRRKEKEEADKNENGKVIPPPKEDYATLRQRTWLHHVKNVSLKEEVPSSLDIKSEKCSSQQRPPPERERNKYMDRAKNLDRLSRGLFPLGFFLFNLMYWNAYLLFL